MPSEAPAARGPEDQLEVHVSIHSQFFRTTWLFSATKQLELPVHSASLRRISTEESEALADHVSRRNAFARHSRKNSFYLKRIQQLANATIIEVLRPGPLDSVLPTARALAALVEKVAFISSILGLRRERMHHLVAISQHRRYGFDLAISPGCKYLHSSERQEVLPRGIPVDDTFVRRFNRCKCGLLVDAATSRTDIGNRVEQGINWLFESRQDSDTQAAVVKTSIALESLLIASDSEGLRGPLAERAAFILTDDPVRRRRIAKNVRVFYDLRSSIVHGGHRKAQGDPAGILDGMDRLVLLLLLTVASNAAAWTSITAVVESIEDVKWGSSGPGTSRPFPESHLSRALKMIEAGTKPNGRGRTVASS
jgi:hypothetical protein